MPLPAHLLVPKTTFPAPSFQHIVLALAQNKEFAHHFEKDPIAALQEIGISVPLGIKFPTTNPFRAPRNPDNPVDPPDGGGGPGHGIPALTSGDVVAGANGWGIVFTLSHNAAEAVSTSLEIVAQFLSIAGDLFPPAAFAIGLVSTFLSLNAWLIQKVDIGNGVYLTVPWLLPGVVVPGSR